MNEANKILVALDFSAYSQATLEQAAYWARLAGARLIVISIINQRDVEALKTAQRYTETQSIESYVQRLQQERNRMIDDCLIGPVCQGLSLDRIVKVGFPAQEILQAITRTGCDLAVIGTKGRGGVAESIFGSTAQKILRRSPVPVLSVPPSGTANHSP